MVVRLLLVLLVLVGQLPLRVCACGAADHTTPEPVPHPCGESHDTPTPDPLDDERRHEPDCPALDPRPALTCGPIAVVESGEDTAAAVGLVFALSDFPTLNPPPVRITQTAHPPGEPPVPLYISLHVLRN